MEQESKRSKLQLIHRPIARECIWNGDVRVTAHGMLELDYESYSMSWSIDLRDNRIVIPYLQSKIDAVFSGILMMERWKVDRGLANQSPFITASQGTSNIPFACFLVLGSTARHGDLLFHQTVHIAWRWIVFHHL